MTRRDRFERLYEEHWTAVLGYCRRRASLDVADEALNETFLVAWRRLDAVPRDERTWLIGVARKVLANHWRGEHRRAALEGRLAATTWRITGGDADAPDAEAVRLAVARLSEPDREAIVLVYWDGLTPAQAAKVLEVSPATLRVRLHRARRRLAQRIGTRVTSLAEEAAS